MSRSFGSEIRSHLLLDNRYHVLYHFLVLSDLLRYSLNFDGRFRLNSACKFGLHVFQFDFGVEFSIFVRLLLLRHLGLEILLAPLELVAGY